MTATSPHKMFFSQFPASNSTSPSNASNQTPIQTQRRARDSFGSEDTPSFVHNMADSPACRNTSFGHEDSLSAMRFSSRLQLTTPVDEKMDFSFTPTKHLFPSLSPSPAICRSGRRRVNFGQCIMQSLCDDSTDDEGVDENENPTGFCFNDPVPPLQECDTQSSCNSCSQSDLESSPMASKTRSRSSRSVGATPFKDITNIPMSLSQDSGMDQLTKEHNSQRKRFYLPPSKWNKTRIGTRTPPQYKQTKMDDFFGRRSNASKSVGNLRNINASKDTSPLRPFERVNIDDEQSRSAFTSHRVVSESDSSFETGELDVNDFLFDTSTFQIATVRNKRLHPAVHHTGTLKVNASEWMVRDDASSEVGMQSPSHRRVPPRSSSTPLRSRARVIGDATKGFCGGEETKERFCLPVNRMTDDGCRCISPETMSDVMIGRYNDVMDHFVVVDCRFTYEYAAGHVQNALHVQDRELLSNMYAANKQLSEDGKVVCWIFYCEFSQQRAPETATWFRKHDRKQHIVDYPTLSFPNVYILQGGFSKFWATYTNSPTAQLLFHRDAYLSMWDSEYEISRKNHTSLRRSLWEGGKGARKNKLRQRTRRSRSLERGKR